MNNTILRYVQEIDEINQAIAKGDISKLKSAKEKRERLNQLLENQFDNLPADEKKGLSILFLEEAYRIVYLLEKHNSDK